MKQNNMEDRESWLALWNKELIRIIKADGDLYKELNAWELLNPPPPLTLEEQKVITIPKMLKQQKPE
jgi:hypothetical protein